MQRLIYILSLILLTTSCFKIPQNSYVTPLDVPEGFDWKTIEGKSVSSANVFSVLDVNGDTVASNLPAGEYLLFVGKSTELKISEEQTAATKAGGNIKSRVYFPAMNKFSTVMFEDLFPSKGDMDMNDIVFGLNVQYDLDNQGRVSNIYFTIEPRAIGSTFEKIGLAVNFLGKKVAIKNITSTDKSFPFSNFFKVNLKNGEYSPELNNSKSVVVPLTGDFRSYFAGSSDLFVNVRNSEPAITSTRFTVSIELNSNSYSYNEFSFLGNISDNLICIDLFSIFDKREREVHFKGQKATERFSSAYFVYTYPKTDFSTLDNWVWAIMSEKSIRHAQEQIKIYSAYPNFKTWAEIWSRSATTSRSDWYRPNIISNLYTKKDFNYDE